MRRGMILRVFFATQFLFAFAIACSRNGVHRTDLHSWKTVELRNEGITIDFPTDASNLQLHYRSNGVADATWMISVAVERKSDSSFKHPIMPDPKNEVSADADYMKWLKWKTAYHPETSVYERPTESKEYRRDVSLANGDVVSIDATYHYALFSQADRLADDAAIRRVLGSAKPIQP